MIYPDASTFAALAENADIVPVYAEQFADMETPVTVLARFQDSENAFLLESMEGGETWGRYSFVGIEPKLLFEADHSAGPTGTLMQLRDVYRNVRTARLRGLPRFVGGAVGYIAYEAVSEFERLPNQRLSTGEPPPCSKFLKADRMVIFDNLTHTLKILVCTRPHSMPSVHAAYRAAIEAISAMAERLEQPAPHSKTQRLPPVDFSSNVRKADFTSMVNTAKRYIYEGEIIQVVLSQRFSAQADVSAFNVYRALRFLNPSPYIFFLKIGKQTLVGSSPEVMVRLTGRHIELRPIAGTRPRSALPEQDALLARELASSEKEKAEHVMLVDLGRNDVGRVAEPGTVRVTEYMTIERYSHVMHLVSHVEGLLRKGFDAYDVIKATFPAGTLTGAPKIRAMEIIRELEPELRGAYGGAIGYIGYDGNMDLAITIRTLDIRPGIVSVQAGAGIVYDSDPEREFEETCHKAAALQKAVHMAGSGLEIGTAYLSL